MELSRQTCFGSKKTFSLKRSVLQLLLLARLNSADSENCVEGTGVITLAAIMAGLHVSGLKLTDMRLVVFGSGTAGIGIADQVRDAIAAESGKSKEDAAKQIW